MENEAIENAIKKLFTFRKNTLGKINNLNKKYQKLRDRIKELEAKKGS